MAHGGKRDGAGRKKGSTQKTTDVMQACSELGYDPFNELIMLAQSTDSEMTRFNVAKELAQYLAPKRKQVDQTAEVTHKGELSKDDADDILRSAGIDPDTL